MPVTSTFRSPSTTAPGTPRARSSSLMSGVEDTGLDNRWVIADIGGHRFDWGSRTYVMGIVNVTPDSFSGDGLGDDREAAVAQGLRMVADGADLIDVGGESTRPGHVPVTTAEEIARTDEVVRRLSKQSTVPVSIDTYKLEVAESAVAAGATIINDVWGLVRSPTLADLVDPGIGFGKTANQNWEVMRRLEELRELGQPVLIGTSRKSFVGKLLDLPVSARLEGTAATVTAAILRGADVVRVHDVAEMMRVVRVADRMR